MIRKIPELLAPAGGKKQLIAAVENGADAVYLGGTLFNARIQADNFNEEELRTCIDYAHLRNVKIYVTLNILLKDEELLPALQYAERLYEMGADALIVQDLGLAALLRKYLSRFAVHLSTQGSVYNLSGVKRARELGFSRVVLARELSLEEIRAITKENICEIEVFVHGALCMCYSGQCQMSRVLGGGERSGNRGLCAQPCRLPYKDSKGRVSYALSPKDLCGIDVLRELTEAGVASLKIEGRMKSAEYVAAVTGIYRKYLDLYEEYGQYQVTEEDRETLLQVFNRGGFTKGYWEGNPGESLLSGEMPKHQGVYAGRVVNKVRGTDLVDVKPVEKLEIGDGIEIRSRKLTGNVITYRQERPGGILRLGDLKGSVRQGDAIFRITDARRMKILRKTYEEGGPEGVKHRKKIAVQMSLFVRIGEHPRLMVEEDGLCVTACDKSLLAEKAEKRPLDPLTAEKQLRKTGGTPFRVSDIYMDIESESSLPLSSLNRLRREALVLFEQEKCERQRPAESVSLPSKLRFPTINMEKRLSFYLYRGSSLCRSGLRETIEQLCGDLIPVRIYVPLSFFMEQRIVVEGAEIVPYILNISKGKLDRYIEENFEYIVEKTRDCGIAIGNLSWSREFLSQKVPVYADYGLNLYNREALQAVCEQGMIPIALSHESWDPASGPIPLMLTEHLFLARELTDRKGKMYEIVYNEEGDKNIIFPKVRIPAVEKIRKYLENVDGEIRIYIP